VNNASDGKRSQKEKRFMISKSPQLDLPSNDIAKLTIDIDARRERISERFISARREAEACYAELDTLVQRAADIAVPHEQESEKLQLVAALRAALQVLGALTVVPSRPPTYRDTKALQSEIEELLLNGTQIAFDERRKDEESRGTYRKVTIDLADASAIMRERAANLAQALSDRIKPADALEAVASVVLGLGADLGR
jgi:low affinity Fe/Cu permease